MPDLAFVTSLPEVRGAVLGDVGGAFHDAVEVGDAEAVAAVSGFVSSLFIHAGDHLGLGQLRRVSIASEARACLMLLEADAVTTVFVDKARALAAVERSLDAAVQGQG